MTNSIHPSLLERKIIHFDMDAFYANIEIRDDPSLIGKPIVVGGSPQSRAVVCTASYEARKFGIRSAMPCSQAARLCPKAIFIKPNFEKYVAVAQEIRKIFAKYSSLIEPISLDEAYLDVTHNPQGLFAVKIAKLIQDEIFECLHLTGSAGIAPNKLLAKIASDYRKPKGLTVVLPEHVMSFLGPLPLRKINGVGPMTEKVLNSFGLKNCADVWQYSLENLIGFLGQRRAQWIYEASRGIDHRLVKNSRVRKSFGHERTFESDILDPQEIQNKLNRIIEDLVQDLNRKNLGGRTIVLKVRYDNFERITRSQTLPAPTADPRLIKKTCLNLLQHTEASRRKIRLLGVSLTNLHSRDLMTSSIN